MGLDKSSFVHLSRIVVHFVTINIKGRKPLGAGLTRKGQQIVLVNEVIHFCPLLSTKHLLSRLSIYLDGCVQTSVAVGNNMSARLIVLTQVSRW